MRTKHAVLCLCILVLACLPGCSTGQRDRTAGEKTEPGASVGRFLIGQAYPTRRVYLQPLVADESAPAEWPATVTFYPLAGLVEGAEAAGQTARFEDQVVDVYIPELERMPPIAESKCTPDGYASAPDYQYAAAEQLEDYFDRGMPDNCQNDDSAGRYGTESQLPVSYPVLAVHDMSTAGITVDYEVAGQSRPLSSAERERVSTYVKDFKARFKEAFGVDYSDESSIIGAIPTLADATIVAEFHFPDSGYTARVSTWEQASISYHLYRRFVLDILQDGLLVQSYEVGRFQGVLG